MNIPKEFDAIRPFEPEELPAAYDRLLADAQFRRVVAVVYPDVPFDVIAAKMRACKTNLDFQMAFCYDLVSRLMARLSTGYELSCGDISTAGNYTFISNHRDIVLDAALLDKLLVDADFHTTCEIAIGDNLLSLPWVKDLVRINRSFIVERGLPMREMLLSSRRLSDYMHFAVSVKQTNIWIAQRQGRAKDSDDRTQEAIIKMMAMGGEGTPQQRICQMKLVPLAISYELDPCDFLKAQELQCRRDNPAWQKGPTDDIVSMRTGILGQKGHVHYACAPCINEWIASLPADMPRADFFRAVAEHVDHEIHRRYRIYANNWIALDLLRGNSSHAGHYTEADLRRFEDYLAAQMAKITLDGKDEPFLRQCMLTMYANPLINYLAAQ